MKKVVYIIIGIVGIWGALFIIDFILCLSSHKPLIFWKQEQYAENGENVTEYYGLGYKVVEYSKGWIKDYKMVFITTEVMKSDFIIIDKTENCKGTLNYFYEDTNFKYYFNCKKNVYLRYKDGSKKNIVEALNEKRITIQELEKKGLVFNKESKIDFTFEVKKDSSCTYLTADPSKMKKMNEELSYYCIEQANIYVDKNYLPFEQSFNKTISLDNILYEMKKEMSYESGAIMYSTASYRILVCSNKTIVLGPNEMEYFDIFCD